MDENSIECDFQTDGNHYVDLRQSYLAPKLKQVKRCSYDTYTVKEAKIEHTAEE